MKSIIVGTAGHIDHGKTALVKALTGIDADRLEEEKRRGITIDLGFAHLALPSAKGETIQFGFIDVPGHERFVRNMLAGVGGIDLVLLIIAADESIKPQTREHFDILQLLGVKHGITVVTKSDAVDADTLDVVRLEIEEFLKETFLAPPGSPLLAVSSRTGRGLEELKRAMILAAENVPSRDSRAIPRLPIDRVFTMKGFGTVVTGTLLAGTMQREDELEIFPYGKKVRVRGIQVHGQAADRAIAGQRTALNLAGASVEDLSRGMVLAPPDTFVRTRRADVKLQLLSSAARPLKPRTRAHFHAHTMETVADLRLHGQPQLAPGGTAFASITFPAPALLLPGDRFILRQFSPVTTIGGGIVLDALPIRAGAKNKTEKKTAAPAAFFESLEILQSLERRAAILTLRVTRRGRRGLTLAETVAETGWRREQITELVPALVGEGLLMRLQDRLFAAHELTLAEQNLLDAVSNFHEKDPLKAGMAKQELRNEMNRVFGMAPELFDAGLSSLAQRKRIELIADLVRSPGRGVQMKDEEAESKRTIEDAFSGAGLKVPDLQAVLAGLKIDKARAQKIVTLLLRDKILVKISSELVFHRSALDRLRNLIARQKSKSAKIDITAFKELTGVSRKYAIPLLEYLDRERVTRREGDARIIL